jgi:chemotaxis response regulator CheB
MVRQGLRALLESYGDIQVVGEASNELKAVEMTEQPQPSMVVMDINMPVMNGIEATAKIKSSHPHKVVIGMSVNAAGENQKNHEDSWRIEIVDQRVSRRTSAHSDSRQLESHGMTGNVGSIFVPVARPQSVLTRKAYR